MTQELVSSLSRTIWQTIERYETIVLHRHILPDYDALGSVFGLREIIKARWPEKRVYVVGGDAEAYHLVPVPDEIGDEIWQDALAIICDCSTADRVDDQRFRLAEMTLKIDHHQDFEPFGDISWVDTGMVAACEMIVDLYLAGREEFGIEMTEPARLYLFCGFVTDSQRFQFVSAEQAPRFYSYVQMLLQTGSIAPQEIMRRIYLVNADELRFIGYLKQHFQQPIAEMVYCKIDAPTLERFGIDWQQAHGNSNSMMGIRGVLTWALFVEVPAENRIVCEMRSAAPTINTLAHRYGGGGHRLACGCPARDWQQVDEIIAELQRLTLAWKAEHGMIVE